MSGKRRLVWGAVVAAVVVVIGVLVWSPWTPSSDAPTTALDSTEGGVGDSEPTPAPEPVPVETPPSTITEDVVTVDADATEIVSPPLAAMGQALKNPDVPVEFEMVADGAALGDLRSEAEQHRQDSTQQRGEPTIVSATVISRDDEADPATVTVEMCLDRSAVTLVQADGSTLPAAEPTRVRQLWTMAPLDGEWKLLDRGFTDELEC